MRLRLWFLFAVFLLALLWNTDIVNAHKRFPNNPSVHCAPQIPPPVAGPLYPAPASPGSVLINEVLPNPKFHWNCSTPSNSSFVAFDAWIELYNPQLISLNLYSVHAFLSFSTSSQVSRYYLPLGSAIAAHGFLIIFPNLDMFNMSMGSSIYLSIGTVAIDQVSSPMLVTDQSFGRVPDGSSHWQITSQPTIDASNNPAPTSPSITPTASKTRRSHGGGSSSSDTTSADSPPINGTQTAWNKVALPTMSTSTPGNTNTLPTSSHAANQQNSHLLFVLIPLGLLLLCLLYCCWRVFRPPS